LIFSFFFQKKNSERGKASSDKFAQKHNLPLYDYVLYPRVTGFIHSVNQLKGHVSSIIDVSVAYDPIPGKRHSLLIGEFPNTIHFNFQKYQIKDLPTTDQELGKWLTTKWEEKEHRLKNFYADGDFKAPKRLCSKDRNPSSVTTYLFLNYLFWLITIAITVYLTIQYSILRWYVLFSTLLFLAFTMIYDGFDNIEVSMLTKERQKNEKKSN